MKVLVYDLGGGTFDVSLIELAAGSFRTLATDGDVQLGGRDWDARLRNYAAEEFVKKHGRDPRENNLALGRLDRAAEEAKHTLSVRDRADIHVEHAGRACDLSVTRSLFEELTADLLQRTAHTTRQMFSGGRYAWRDVSYVLLVGGSTRMPMVARMLRELSELEPQHGVNPDEAVARGAAIYAGYLLAQDDARRPGARFRVVDVNAHSLGIESIEAETLRKQNVIRWKKAVTDGAGFEPLARLIADVQPTANPAMPTWLQQNLLAAQQDPAAAPPQMLAPAAAETKWPSTGPSLIIPAGESGDGYALQETDEPQQNYAPQQEYATQQEYGPQADATPQASGFSAEYPAAHEPTDEGDDLTGPYVRPKRRKSSATARTVVNLVAHVMSSVLGLSLGYYILCWIKPESNFLHLNLPLLPPAVSEKPATPDAPSAAPRKP
jgi:hypothetical protein